MMVSLIGYAKCIDSTYTALRMVYADVSTFVLFSGITVFLIEVICVTAAVVTLIFSLGRVRNGRTASCACLATRASRVLEIPELIIALMGTVVSGG